jgi:hypothetical protein
MMMELTGFKKVLSTPSGTMENVEQTGLLELLQPWKVLISLQLMSFCPSQCNNLLIALLMPLMQTVVMEVWRLMHCSMPFRIQLLKIKTTLTPVKQELAMTPKEEKFILTESGLFRVPMFPI